MSELSEFIAELDRLAGEIDERVADRADKIKTPDDVARMNDDFRRDVLDKDDPDGSKRCKEYIRALVEIGGNQDVLVGECRWVGEGLAATRRHPRGPRPAGGAHRVGDPHSYAGGAAQPGRPRVALLAATEGRCARCLKEVATSIESR